MSVDLKGAIKDNQKLLLSIIGIFGMAMFISLAGKSEGGIFDFWRLGGGGVDIISDPDNDNGTPTNSVAKAVNNGQNNKYSKAPVFNLEDGVDYQAIIKTNLGSITLDLYEEETPETVNNFVFLANDDFYEGSSFHRIIKDFIIQGGDPKGNGSGGPGYEFDDEIASFRRFEPFTVAMANAGPDTNGSQFFITTRNSESRISSLNGNYTIFGEVIDGFATVDKIEKVAVDSKNNDYLPYDPVVIQGISIIEK